MGATIREIVVNGVRFTVSEAQSSTTKNIDPLVLDLDGNGVELTDWVSGRVFFDMLGDGTTRQAGWVAGGDGFLVLDRNGNGTIDDITETISGKFTGGAFADGFAALASLAQAGATSFSRATSRTNPVTGNLYLTR